MNSSKWYKKVTSDVPEVNKKKMNVHFSNHNKKKKVFSQRTKQSKLEAADIYENFCEEHLVSTAEIIVFTCYG